MTASLNRISELTLRYRTQPVGKEYGVFDTETGTLLDGRFPDEAMARGAARLQAAADIQALFGKREAA